jgi:hypothetical protein
MSPNLGCSQLAISESPAANIEPTVSQHSTNTQSTTSHNI